MPRTIVFAGPTVDAHTVRGVLPEATVLPPIAATDLWPLRLHPDDTVVIIDGYFLQRRAIRHKEIVEALGRGVTVVGGSSMGALRAAELDDFGMVGVGQVYQWYADGTIDGDDEVAVVHGTADSGYPSHTVALVNLRASLLAARAAGQLDARDEERIIGVVGAMPFTRRDRETMVDRVRQACDDDCAARLVRALDHHSRDVKRSDAIAVLKAVRDRRLGEPVPMHPSPHVRDTDVSRISLMAQWRVWEEADKHGERELSPGFVLTCARILSLDYPSFHEQVAIDALTADALVELDDAAMPHSSRETDVLVRRLLVARGLLGGGVSPADLAHDWLTPDERGALTDEEALRAFVRRVHTAPWRELQAVARLEASGRLPHWESVATRVQRINEGIRARRPAFSFPAIPASVIREWCSTRWLGGPVDDKAWRMALADRGYVDEGKFTVAARPVYPFALHRSQRYDDLDSV